MSRVAKRDLFTEGYRLRCRLVHGSQTLRKSGSHRHCPCSSLCKVHFRSQAHCSTNCYTRQSSISCRSVNPCLSLGEFVVSMGHSISPPVLDMHCIFEHWVSITATSRLAPINLIYSRTCGLRTTQTREKFLYRASNELNPSGVVVMGQSHHVCV